MASRGLLDKISLLESNLFPSACALKVSLPSINIYNVEYAELPAECHGGLATPAPLPPSIPLDKIMSNIEPCPMLRSDFCFGSASESFLFLFARDPAKAQNLDLKGWSEQARNLWFKDFKSQCSRAVIQDTFWFCICWYFKPGKHLDVETRLFDRISANFVGLFSSLNPSRKDFFFRCYADAVAQAVLYSMFLAYPKSRIDFTDKFRKDLVIRISYWTSGICPEFVDTSHWKLNLGKGDVLQAAPSQPHQRNVEAANAVALRTTATQPLLGQLSADSLADKTAWMGHFNRRPRRKLQYSPLVENFLRAKKYSSVNLVRATSMHMTTAEQRAKKMDVKHAMLAERATAARERCDKLCNEYAPCLGWHVRTHLSVAR